MCVTHISSWAHKIYITILKWTGCECSSVLEKDKPLAALYWVIISNAQTAARVQDITLNGDQAKGLRTPEGSKVKSPQGRRDVLFLLSCCETWEVAGPEGPAISAGKWIRSLSKRRCVVFPIKHYFIFLQECKWPLIEFIMAIALIKFCTALAPRAPAMEHEYWCHWSNIWWGKEGGLNTLGAI